MTGTAVANCTEHKAESQTGDPKSQYQFWLSARLRGQYEVVNRGYGRDDSKLLLDRFERDLKPLNAQFCIVQIGTNDIFSAQKEAQNDQEVLDRYLTSLRNNTVQCIQICRNLGIVPLLGNLIPRSGFKGMYREALWAHNEWVAQYCNENKDVLFIDFYSSGKSNIPPTPLEDPNDLGGMNPIYDGDTTYDPITGEVLSRGNGIHPNIQGYKLMSEAIPLKYFQTVNEGIKLYLDENCTIEEKRDETNLITKTYVVTFPNVIRGKKKSTTRYIKNCGTDRLMYALFPSKEVEAKTTMILNGGAENSYCNGTINGNVVHKVELTLTVESDSENPEIKLGLASRAIINN